MDVDGGDIELPDEDCILNSGSLRYLRWISAVNHIIFIKMDYMKCLLDRQFPENLLFGQAK